MTYGQPYGGQHPYGQYGGFGAPPPKKNTGAIVAVVAVVVVVLGVIGVTGFVAPGFFLSEETTTAQEPTTTEPTAEPVEEQTAEPAEEQTAEPVEEPTEQRAPTAGGQPVDSGALSAMETFLDSVNTGDAAQAKAQLCPDAISNPADVDELVGYQPELEIDPTMDGVSAGDRSVQLYLSGTAKGQELDGYSTNLWVTSYDGPWCVHAFRAVVI
jgi:hypothetical protein